MRLPIGFIRSRLLLRVAAVSIVAVSAAGCSSDAMRFSENPFTNPFASDRTAAVPDRVVRRTAPDQPARAPVAPVSTVAAQPLPPVGSVSSRPLSPVSDSDLGEPIAATGSIAAATTAVVPATTQVARDAGTRVFRTPRGFWSTANAASIVAQPGDTTASIGARYGVPAAAIAGVNGLSGGAIPAGSTIVIPTFSTSAPANAVAVAAPARTAAAPAPAEPLEPRAVRTVAVSPDAEAPAPRTTTARAHQVKPGETLGGIAARYGLSRRALAEANGLDEWAQVKIGQRLRLVAAAPAATRAAPDETAQRKLAEAEAIIAERRAEEARKLAEAEAIIAERRAAEAARLANANERARNEAEKAKAVADRKLAEARQAAEAEKLAEADRLKKAAERKQAQADRARQVDEKKAEDRKLAAARKAEEKKLAEAEKLKKAEERKQAEAEKLKKAEDRKKAEASAKRATEEAERPARAATPRATPADDRDPELDTADNRGAAPRGPDFRWPVRGRIIQAFGQSSDGINISVPEGTSVRAAEDGVVAYAGSELKGYGNLILVRHSNGYVTAYGHNKNISVKRGEQIRRGQVIGTSGATGDVSSPQLLFEIRKGATPVDPRRYLAGG